MVFEISVFTTQELYEKCQDNLGDGFAARDMAAEWVDNAMSRSGETARIKKSSEKIWAPTEQASNGFNAHNYCTGEFEWHNSLYKWWMNYERCSSHDVAAKDSNVLITAADGGGLAASRWAVVGGTYHIANVYDSYVNYSFHHRANNMESLLEEVGHCLTDDMADYDYRDSGDGFIAHDSGMTYERPEGVTISPIGVTGDTSKNNCPHSVNKYDWDGNAAEFKFSNCTTGFFSEKSSR